MRQCTLPVGDAGLIESGRSSEDTRSCDDAPKSGEAKSEAVSTNSGLTDPAPAVPADPDLTALIGAWPALPAPIRAGIVAMIRAAGLNGELKRL
jgi:hypothetical protein